MMACKSAGQSGYRRRIIARRCDPDACATRDISVFRSRRARAARIKIKIICRLSEHPLQASDARRCDIAGMKRRDFIALISAALACPSVALAEEAARVYRIYWLSTQAQPDPFLEGFREGLRARGYVEGRNVVLEKHYAI